MDATVSTRTVNVIAVSMSEEEWRAAMVEPDTFFAQVRAELQKFHSPAKVKTAKVKTKKAPKPQPEGKRKNKVGQSKCQYCGEMISNIGIGRHVKKCAQSNAG